jgi:hypothetical protein
LLEALVIASAVASEAVMVSIAFIFEVRLLAAMFCLTTFS